MTRQQIIEDVARIADMADDNEAAHYAEDVLYTDVLRAIADGSCIDPVGCAAEALKAGDIDFIRWYA